MDIVASIKHAAPADQPQSVHQITERLFSAYQVEGGSVRLAGCTLDDRLFIRLDFSEDPPRSLFFNEQLRVVGPDLIEQLGMNRLVALAAPPRLCRRELEEACAAILSMQNMKLGRRFQPSAITAIWPKYAEGRLVFDIGGRTVELAFAGWARTLIAPPWVCPITQRATYHLAATDDGRIVAAEEIGLCEVSHRKVVVSELVVCEATGKRILPEHTALCPVTGQRVLSDLLVVCRWCGQMVAPSALDVEVCFACRRLAPVPPADQRIQALLKKYPSCKRWSHWRFSETSECYILTCSRWWRAVLLVVDRHTFDLKHLATGNRLLGGWRPVPAEEHEKLLNG